MAAASAQLVKRLSHIREIGVGSPVATRFYCSNSFNSTHVEVSGIITYKTTMHGIAERHRLVCIQSSKYFC